MALRTIVRELIRRMIGIVRFLIIRLVTRPAIRGGTIKLATNMALRATHIDMSAGQWEITQVVIKNRRSPCNIRVTLQALVVEISGHVVRIGNVLIIGLMTTITVSGCAGKLAVGMTGSAINIDMRAREREICIDMVE